MVPKAVFIAVVGAVFLAGGAGAADEYRPDEFLKLDLSKAVLSPKPLGPAAQFEPMPVQAKTDAQSTAVHVEPAPVPVDVAPKHANAAPKHVNAAPKHLNAAPRHVNSAPKAAKSKVAHAPAEKPRTSAGIKVARKRTNPLDAQASDTRIQVWPCRSGGICNWQR
jgi:hypothetical protein